MKISEIKSDTFDIVILVIALEINYQLGRKFTNHNTMADRSSKRSQSAECFIESWIKSMREIESSSHDAFNIERCLASGISNNRERSSKAVIYEVHRSENRVNRLLLWGGNEREGRERAMPSRHPSTSSREQYQSNSRRMHDAHPTVYYIYNPCAWHAVTCLGI